MKVIFLTDYNGYQKKGDILEISDNFGKLLIKKGVCKSYAEHLKDDISKKIAEKKAEEVKEMPIIETKEEPKKDKRKSKKLN